MQVLEENWGIKNKKNMQVCKNVVNRWTHARIVRCEVYEDGVDGCRRNLHPRDRYVLFVRQTMVRLHKVFAYSIVV